MTNFVDFVKQVWHNNLIETINKARKEMVNIVQIPVGELKVGDHFIDFKNGDYEYVVSYVDNKSLKVEAYNVEDREAEDACEFGIDDLVEVMA